MTLLPRLLLFDISVPAADCQVLGRHFEVVRAIDCQQLSDGAGERPFDFILSASGEALASLPVDLIKNTKKVCVIAETAGVTLDPQWIQIPRAQLADALCGMTNSEPQWQSTLVGDSLDMARIRAMIEMVARRKCTVLITGETGTGKEVVARAIHMASDRSHLPMVAVNCAALPETLLEAELFGHTKGAFTGAVNQRTGLVERANNSTLFLDEIGEMPLSLQAKLLRMLQEREFLKLGSSTPQSVNVRVLAASNVNLAEAVRQKRFRADLYYRLNVVPIEIPPLRSRRSDISTLAVHLLDKTCREEHLPKKQLSPEALASLMAQDWPGNVRELGHAMEMAALISGARTVVRPSDLPGLSSMGSTPELTFEMPPQGVDFEEVILGVQRALLAEALERSGGNKAKAAALLGMKRTTLTTKVKTLGQCAR